MQENEFEKRIQEEMGEFRLRPSETVWEKVEEQLKKKKRRRVVFFIFMLAGLSLLGFLGYFFTQTNYTQNLVQQDNNTSSNNEHSDTGNKPMISPARDSATNNDQSAIKAHELSQSKEYNQPEKTVNILNNEKVAVAVNDIARKHNDRRKVIIPDRNATAKSARKREDEIARDNSQPTEIAKTQKDKSLNEAVGIAGISQQDIAMNNLTDDSKATDEKSDDKTSDQKVAQPTKTDSEITTDPKVDAAIAATKKKQPASRIKWGIDLSAGRSSSRNNAFSLFDMQKSADMQYSSPVNNNGGGLGIPPRTYPSDVKAGFAFRAGVVAEMKLSKRSSIVSGLQYLYHSNNINVGAYTDTSVVVRNSFSLASRVDAIYQGTHQKNYTNRYHFIQIPLQYQLQLNKGIKTPILWNVGVSAGYLLATNGLVYDTTANGIYYRENEAFNKFQFNLTTGLSFRFGNKSKVQWSVGPEFSLGMNKLMKDDYTKKQYLLYSGLTGRLFFQKRHK